MSTKSLENFFSGKTLAIPSYQRDYAWQQRNVDDLFSDVEEALDSGGGHYMGTFILSQPHPSAPAQVVDGQQRLTTLTMLLNALVSVLEEQEVQQHYRNLYIKSPVTGVKFQVLGDNEQFFGDMLAGKPVTPVSDGQERLHKAYQRIIQRVNVLCSTNGQEAIKKWLRCISLMEVMEFVEPNEGKAIRMFQSVNDRGVPLSRMDIVKSLLVYYSNRYLDAKLDDYIAQQFGKAFRSFNRIKRLALDAGCRVDLIARDTFREDDVLRYHYLAFADKSGAGVDAGGDYGATSDTVLDTFLKPALAQLRTDKAKLNAFVRHYTDDLTGFFGALEQLIEKTHNSLDYYLLWVIQDLSATLYPLAIRLHAMGWLESVGSKDSRTLLQLVELSDLRVFKLRGTNPQAHIFRVTRKLAGSSIDEITQSLIEFCGWFMPDNLIATQLTDLDIYRNPGLERMLLQIEEHARETIRAPALDLAALKDLTRHGLTVEHVMSQDPGDSFHVSHYGFSGNEDYEQRRHRFGNLLLLEGGINSACQNRTVEDKMSAPNLYPKSKLCAVQALSARHAGIGKRFDNAALDQRSSELAQIVTDRWPL
jgi:Protein of unknown function DUF262/Protein of unknown function (DUF1524)